MVLDRQVFQVGIAHTLEVYVRQIQLFFDNSVTIFNSQVDSF
jgi:hypothetical protein